MSNPTTDKTITLGENVYNAEYLRSVSEKVAVRSMPKNDRAQVVNAWKQANGKSVRNHTAEDRQKDLMKKKRYILVAIAEGMGLDVERDANKATIVDDIISKENEDK